MMSIIETCKKLGISAYKIHDRVSGTNKFPPLAEMIKKEFKQDTIFLTQTIKGYRPNVIKLRKNTPTINVLGCRLG